MDFDEAIEQAILEGFANSDITTSRILTVFAVAVLLAVYIYFIYRVHNRDVFYSRELNMTVALMSVITAGIVLALQSSLVISLGMVGALSIVRFRTAIKEPMDLMFLFWSIGSGIMCGAGLYALALISALVVTVLLLLLDLVPEVNAPLILSASVNGLQAEQALCAAARAHARAFSVKSKTRLGGGIDLIAEIRTRDEQALFEACCAVEGCSSVALLSRDGAVVRG